MSSQDLTDGIPDFVTFLDTNKSSINELIAHFGWQFTLDEGRAFQAKLKRAPSFEECCLLSLLKERIKSPNRVDEKTSISLEEWCLIVNHNADTFLREFPEEAIPSFTVGTSIAKMSAQKAKLLGYGIACDDDTKLIDKIAAFTHLIGRPLLSADFESINNDGYCFNSTITLGLKKNTALNTGPIERYAIILVGNPVVYYMGQNTKKLEELETTQPLFLTYLCRANETIAQNKHLSDCLFKPFTGQSFIIHLMEFLKEINLGAEINLDDSSEYVPALCTLLSKRVGRFFVLVPAQYERDVLAIYNETFALQKIYPNAGAALIGYTRLDNQLTIHSDSKKIININLFDNYSEVDQNTFEKANDDLFPLNSSVKNPPCDQTKSTELLIKPFAEKDIHKQTRINLFDKQVGGHIAHELNVLDEMSLITPWIFEDDFELQKKGIVLTLKQLSLNSNSFDSFKDALLPQFIYSIRKMIAHGFSLLGIGYSLIYNQKDNHKMIAKMNNFISLISEILNKKNNRMHIFSQNFKEVSYVTKTHLSVSYLGIIKNVNKMITADFKKPGSKIIFLKHTFEPLRLKQELALIEQLHELELLLALQVIKPAQMLYQAALMTSKNGIGCSFKTPDSNQLIFTSEDSGYLCEVAYEKMSSLHSILNNTDLEFWVLGTTLTMPIIKIDGEQFMDAEQIKNMLTQNQTMEC